MTQSISVSDFNPLWKAQFSDPTTVVIDVRMPAEYKEIHVDGAKNIPLSELNKRRDELEDFQHVYVLCKSGARSQTACTQLKNIGKELTVVEGGTDAWNEAGFPVVKTSVKIPLMRQVMLSAGSLVLIGTLGALFITPAFIYLAVFVGAGLAFAGATGWCGMALLLGKMPWNK